MLEPLHMSIYIYIYMHMCMDIWNSRFSSYSGAGARGR